MRATTTVVVVLRFISGWRKLGRNLSPVVGRCFHRRRHLLLLVDALLVLQRESLRGEGIFSRVFFRSISHSGLFCQLFLLLHEDVQHHLCGLLCWCPDFRAGIQRAFFGGAARLNECRGERHDWLAAAGMEPGHDLWSKVSDIGLPGRWVHDR